MTITLHKLTAGDGYTYLTRQVAAGDATERGYKSLGDYYSAKGELPGTWWGNGLDSLGSPVVVTEQQMVNLFGQGIHPNADRIVAEMQAHGHGKIAAESMTRLGSPYRVTEGTKEWRTNLAERYSAWNQVHGLPSNAPIPADERTRIRTEVAREMFVEQHGRAPLSPGELSGFVAQQSRPNSTAVAGFDVTFSPVKSVSALWAVAPRAVAEEIEAAHNAAVTAALEFLQTEAGYTRVGTNGVAQVDICGLVAARFTHRDSRAGDPDLHTHVAISNKVQTLDGRWLALHGRMLYQMTVAASEFYNAQLEAEVTARIGGAFRDRPGATEGKRPIRELVGVDERLTAAWSSRRQSIEAATAVLAAKFVADHGRVPTAVESLRLAQQATLSTRDRKHEPRALSEQRAAWRREALEVVGGRRNLDVMIDRVHAAVPRQAPYARDLVGRLAAATVRVLEQSRARWRENQVLAEAIRQTRAAGVESARVNDVARDVTARVLADGGLCVPVIPDPETLPDTPVGLQRRDGSSVFRVAKARMFTTSGVLEAEQRIVATAGDTSAARVSDTAVELAVLEWSANAGGRQLNTEQSQMVRDVVTGTRRVHLALAPAGTGKTTVMGVIAGAWQNAGGTVVGLAPQASAAEELRDALTNVRTDTLDKLVHELVSKPDVQRPLWVQAINARSLVIVDEAGLASTRNLDVAVRYVTGRGGRVLLVGDDQQRAAAGAGGVLRDIDAAYGCSSLVEVMRFADPVEGAASLALRAGDTSAVGFYADHDRLHAVTSDTAVDAVFDAWTADVKAGVDSVMMAPTLDLVGQLNERARAARLAKAQRPVGVRAILSNGDVVSTGDIVVAKKNDRRLRLGSGTDFVQNNHRFTVTAVAADGALTCTQIGTGKTLTLPAGYARANVRLGYAHTLAGCQGMTVGSPAGKTSPGRAGTAHALLTPGMTRNDVYPGMTRGVTANHAYIDTQSGGSDPHVVVKPESIEPATVHELFAGMVTRDGSNRSASTEQREAVAPALLLGAAADAYAHAVVTGAETVIGPDAVTELAVAAERAVPGVTTAAAWETALRGHLVVLAGDGKDPVALLEAAASSRELDSARDVAAVLDYRLDPSGNHSQEPGPLQWLPAIPTAVASLPVWEPYLTARANRVRELSGQVAADARGWTAGTAQAWAAPYLADPVLVADLAVWRAANTVDPADLRPAGPRTVRIAMSIRHRELVKRCVAVAGDPADGADRWAAVLERLGVTEVQQDDYWPVLAGRLNVADTAGLPVAALLEQAVARGPLPVEDSAAALWWRLAQHLGSTTSVGTAGPLRPVWTSDIENVLGGEVAGRIISDRLWPVIVARVDTAAETGADPVRLVTDAAGMLHASIDTFRAHQYATGLLLNVSMLADPEPVHEHDEPVDPETLPPVDMHDGVTPDAHVVAVDEWVPQAAEPVVDEPADPEFLQFAPEPTDGWVSAYAMRRGHAAVEAAWEFYQREAPGSWVPEYLSGRGLAATPAGFAPAGWTRLVDYLRGAGYTDTELLSAGLARTGPRDGRLIDRFNNRLVMPIHADDGGVVGFVGRKPPTDMNVQAPKYVNSPTTDLYEKGALPYGLTPDAVARLRAGADLVIVEGPMDAAAVNAASAPTPVVTDPRLPTINTEAQFEDIAQLLTPAEITAITKPLGLRYHAIETSPGVFEQAMPFNQYQNADLVKATRAYFAAAAPVVASLGVVAVAPLGTALTAEQLAALDRVAPLADRRVIVALDNDPAGIHAARAAHTLLLAAGVDAETVTLPAGQDPAQVLAEQGQQRLAAALARTRPLASLVVDDITRQWLTRIPQGQPGIEERFNAVQEAAPVIAAMSVAERNRQAGRLAELTRLDLFRVLDSIERHVPAPAPVLVGDLQMPQPPKREPVMAATVSTDVAERLQAGRERAAQLKDERNARKLAVAEAAQQVALKPETHGPTHKPVIAPAVQNRLHL